MDTSTDNSWNDFLQHVNLLDKLYPEQINNLKELTRTHLADGNNEKKAKYVKVVYVDHYDDPLPLNVDESKKTPRVVLWEVHPAVYGLDPGWFSNATNVESLKKALSAKLPPSLKILQIELYFASTQLKKHRHVDDENLRLYLLFYCDKLYARPISTVTNQTWQNYKKYFKKAQSMVLANPNLYEQLCRELRSLIDKPENEISESDVYGCLMLLRNLPESLVYAANGHIVAAKSVRELLTILELLEGKEDETGKGNIYEEVIYNVLDALEWLAYLVPKMYDEPIDAHPLYSMLVDGLEECITNRRHKLAIRMEAAWALGWASVSSIAVATCVHDEEMSARSRLSKLNNTALRYVVGVAYLRASFTLASFGPARVTPGAEKMLLPGSYLSEQTFSGSHTSNRDYARQAASEVVYSELTRLVRGGTGFLLIFMSTTVLWLLVNGLSITLLLQGIRLEIVIALSIPPTFLLLSALVMLSVQWGIGYWRRIVLLWLLFVIIAVSPWLGIVSWQHIIIIVGSFIAFVFAIVAPFSAWITIITGIPSLVNILRSRRSPSRK